MELLKMANGRWSAELAQGEWRKLHVRLGRFGELRERAVADFSIVEVGEAQFIRTDEWDGAALIATNLVADRILLRLARGRTIQGKRRKAKVANSNSSTRRIRRGMSLREPVHA